jgi:hypothetical protein
MFGSNDAENVIVVPTNEKGAGRQLAALARYENRFQVLAPEQAVR